MKINDKQVVYNKFANAKSSKIDKFSIQSFLRSFKYAFDGLKILLTEERNYVVHCLATIVIIGFGLFYRLRGSEWAMLLMVIGTVLITETLNTSIENIMDFVSTDHQPAIKRIKDISAAAVLISAIVSVLIGLIIFVPKIFPTVS